jgi:hypothetical protein
MYRLRNNLPPVSVPGAGRSGLPEIGQPQLVQIVVKNDPDASEDAPAGTKRSRRSRMHAKQRDAYFAGYAPQDIRDLLIDLGLLPIEDAEDREAIGRALIALARAR